MKMMTEPITESRATFSNDDSSESTSAPRELSFVLSKKDDSSQGSSKNSIDSPQSTHCHKHTKENSTLIRKTTAGFTANVVQLTASIVTVLYIIAPNLTPDAVGQYYLLFYFTILSSLLVSCGIEASNSVFIGRGEERPGLIHTTSLLMTCAMSLVAISLSYIIFPIPFFGLVSKLDPNDFQLAIFTVPFILYQNFSWSIMIGTGHLVLLSRTKIIIALIRIILDYTAIVLYPGVTALVVSFLVTSALGAVILFALSASFAFPEKVVSFDIFKKLFSFGIKSYPGTIAGQLPSKIDSFILNFFQGPGAVGLYGVAAQIAGLPQLFFMAVQNAMFAAVSGAKQNSAIKTVSFLIRCGLLVWTVLVGLGILIVPPLIIWRLGDSYAESGKVFCFLVGGTCATGITKLLIPYFIGTLKRPDLLSGLAWLNVLISTALFYILIPGYSAVGAGVAGLIAYGINLFLHLFFYCRLSKEKPKNFIWPNKRDILSIIITVKRDRLQRKVRALRVH